jgi:hypothetical protein
MFAQPFQFRPINRGKNLPRAHRMGPAASVFAKALHSVERKQLFDLARKSHGETMQ